MSKNLTIDKSQLIKAIMAHAHAASSPLTAKYAVAVDHDDEQPQGRVIWCDTPSSKGGYLSNFVGEENYDVIDFVDDEYADLSWGDTSEIRSDYGLDEDAEISDEIMAEHEEAAASFVEENLRGQVDLDGVTYKVKFS